MAQKTLSLAETKNIALYFQNRGDEIVHNYKVSSMEKKKSEERILVVSKFRVFLFRVDGKLQKDLPFLDIIELATPSDNEILFKSKDASITIQTEGVLEIITSIYQEAVNCFIGIHDSFPLNIPSEKLEKVKASVQKPDHVCGGFVSSYTAICDYLGIKPAADVVWDVENLYVWNDVTEFNLLEIAMRKERLSLQDWKALLHALKFNTWFTSLVITSFKLEKEVLSFITEIFHHNRTIEKLVLKDIGAPSTFFIALANSFNANPNLALNHIDISHNNMEDKGMVSFASAMENLKELIHLNVSKNGLSSKGMSNLAVSLRKNSKICSSLKKLYIAGNRVDGECCKALANLFAETKALTTLDISQNNPDFRLLKACPSLVNLDISGTKITTKDSKHLDLFHFLKQAPNIKKFSLKYSAIPQEILNQLLDALPSVEKIDLSDTNLGDAGLIKLTSALMDNKTVKSLAINRIFEKKTSSRTQALNKLDFLINDEKSRIEELYIAGGAKSQLKGDILPFLFSLMTNNNLKTLDISGNQIGNGAGLALGKALSTNTCLKRLYWDENAVTLLGYQIFRNGVLKNNSLSVMPLPINDVIACMKNEKEVSLLVDLLKQIEQKIFQNCSLSDPGPKRQIYRNSSLDLSKAEEPDKPESKPGDDDPANEPQKPVPPPASKKPKKHKFKPVGFDTAHASVLFGELSSVLAQQGEKSLGEYPKK